MQLVRIVCASGSWGGARRCARMLRSMVSRATTLTIASYNVHRCIGRDGRHDPGRVAKVIEELRADVVALQEVDFRYHIRRGVDQLRFLAEATGLRERLGPGALRPARPVRQRPADPPRGASRCAAST